MSNKLYFKMLGSFKAIYKDEHYDLENILGKQLSNIFALFIFNINKIITKNKLIDIFWSDSDNPSSALKYAIHRLRTKLNEIECFENIIVTSQNGGYRVNPEFNISIDCLIIENLLIDGKNKLDYSLIEEGLYKYNASFLSNYDSQWINNTRSYFERLVTSAAKILHDYYINDKDYNKAIEVCEDILKFDEYNERLIYEYINDLINAKHYNNALKYYDYISKKYQNTFNEPIDKNISSLFNLSSTSIDVNNLSFDVSKTEEKIYGPLECDIYEFKKMCEFEYRNSIRTHKLVNIITLEIKSNDNNKYIEVLETVVNKTLRLNDAYTKNGDNQVLLMVEVANKDDEYIVVKRIVDKFYRRYSSDICRINYYIKDIKDLFL